MRSATSGSARLPQAVVRAHPPHNLPAELTSFVGRSDEVGEIRRMLARHRLLTLTGAGGVGKTRLALSVAAHTLDEHPDSTWFVDLAPLGDGAFVPMKVAAVLGVSESPRSPLLQTLADVIGARTMLLVLDNCEHLVVACAALADEMLRACSGLRILATSREPLQVVGERTWRVPPLTLPEPSLNLAEVQSSPAVQLFVDRASAVQPDFRLGAHNMAAVVEICRRLDGIPLAIELAAARARVLSADQIAARLRDSFSVLGSGSRTAPPHQQTLRAAIQWSYDLLSAPQRQLFEQLAVFADGWTIEAAEAVCAGQEIAPGSVLDLLTELVDKSLVQTEPRPDGSIRGRLLETIRQYAWQQLERSGQAGAVRRRHAEWFLEVARQAEPQLVGPEPQDWVDRLDMEHQNLRAVLQWTLEQHEVEIGLELAARIWRFWETRGHIREGRVWLEQLLSIVDDPGASSQTRATALTALGALMWRQAELDSATATLEASLAAHRQLGDKKGTGLVLEVLGLVAMDRADAARAAEFYEQSAVAMRNAGNLSGLAAALTHLGSVARLRGDLTGAVELVQEGLELRRRIGERYGMGQSLIEMANIERARGDLDRSRQLLEQAVGLFQDAGDTVHTAWAVAELAAVTRNMNDHSRAMRLSQDSLRLYRRAGDLRGIAMCLIALGGLCLERGAPDTAARLLAAASTILEMGGFTPPENDDAARAASATRAQLGEATFDVEWAAGRAMSVDEAVDEALSASAPASSAVPGPAHGLTPRELEVLRLVASGRSNREIAEQLVVSVRTVERHITNLYAKIGAGGKAEATAYAFRNGLV